MGAAGPVCGKRGQGCRMGATCTVYLPGCSIEVEEEEGMRVGERTVRVRLQSAAPGPSHLTISPPSPRTCQAATHFTMRAPLPVPPPP